MVDQATISSNQIDIVRRTQILVSEIRNTLSALCWYWRLHVGTGGRTPRRASTSEAAARFVQCPGRWFPATCTLAQKTLIDKDFRRFVGDSTGGGRFANPGRFFLLSGICIAHFPN
ncbi:MAG TPA: hypothetical protein VFY24_15285 [Azospira sp.]|nr:hypothetical protein [Azospira sp.]